KVKIRFRLWGYDKDWINSSGDRKAFYTNLSPGDYHFQVIASNNDGVWNTTGASYYFRVKPFFYETIWFRLLTAAILIGLIWLLVRWRTRAAIQRSQWLETQVAARTDEISRQ